MVSTHLSSLCPGAAGRLKGDALLRYKTGRYLECNVILNSADVTQVANGNYVKFERNVTSTMFYSDVLMGFYRDECESEFKEFSYLLLMVLNVTS